MIERPCKSSADQKIELLVFQKLCNPFRANFFTDTGVNDFDGTMAYRAANNVYAVPISARFISEPAQEFGALGWQSERNRNHRSSGLWFCVGHAAKRTCATWALPPRSAPRSSSFR